MVTIVLDGIGYTFNNDYDLTNILNMRADRIFNAKEPDGLWQDSGEQELENQEGLNI